MKKQKLIIAGFAALLVVSFQNCSKMNFSSNPATAASESLSNDPNNGQTGGVDPGTVVDLNTVPPAGCSSVQQITYTDGQILNIPARGAGQICYIVKLMNKMYYVGNDENKNFDMDVVSNDHGGLLNNHPKIMGSKKVRVLLGGARSIKVAGGPNGNEPIIVDNFFLVGIAPSGLIGDPSYYHAYGTADAVYTDNSVLFKNSKVGLTAFSSGNTASVVLPLDGKIGIGAEYTLDLRALDCGQKGELTDIYLFFQ
jgi:hypothetical protein